MTTPTDDHDDPSASSETPIDDDRLAALRALLRDEPVDTDPAATETRILAALDAAGAAGAGPSIHGSEGSDREGPGAGRPPVSISTPARGRWSARPALVAAAVVAVVGIGAAVWSAADRDAEFMASAGDAATSEGATESSAADAGGVADGSAPADSDVGADAGAAADPSSTLAPAPPAAAAEALVDLGRYDSAQELLDDEPLLERSPGDKGFDAGRTRSSDEQAAELACAATQRSSGRQVLGTATVATTHVLVIEVDGARGLLELPSCRPLP